MIQPDDMADDLWLETIPAIATLLFGHPHCLPEVSSTWQYLVTN